jgi:hypothetical protein
VREGEGRKWWLRLWRTVQAALSCAWLLLLSSWMRACGRQAAGWCPAMHETVYLDRCHVACQPCSNWFLVPSLTPCLSLRLSPPLQAC